MNSSPPTPEDAVDLILRQWANERPDLQTAAMGTIGRLKRCATLIQRQLDATFAAHGLSAWEFDVLATLRRNGPPYRMAPTLLFSSLMVTSGTMTTRLQKLEQAGLVCRIPNPDDARSLLVELTAPGFETIDKAVAAHVVNEEGILAPLPPDERVLLDRQLRALMAMLEAPPPTGRPATEAT